MSRQIIDLQRRIAEVGRIRIGHQVPVGDKGKTRPAKLDTFRLTSPDRTRITDAAKRFGGTPRQWDAPVGKQWEVITQTDTLPVIVPPGDMAFSQAYELWSGGGCLRRCDGHEATYNDDGRITEGECVCDPQNRECDIHTRLSVFIRGLSGGLGVWRIDTQGYYAAIELQGAVSIIRMAAGHGRMLPAALRLEQRMVKRMVDGKPQTRRFAVPMLDVQITPEELLSGATALDAGTVAIESPSRNGFQYNTINDVLNSDDPEIAVAEAAAERYDARQSRNLAPVPPEPDWPTPSIAEQAAAVNDIPSKRRSAAPIAKTGLAPRTAAQAAAATATLGDQDQQEASESAPPENDAKTQSALPIEPEPSGLDELHPDTTTNPEVDYITEPQLKKLSILLREAGFTDRETRHAFVQEAIGRAIGSAKELTKAEASQVIDLLENDAGNPENPDLLSG